MPQGRPPTVGHGIAQGEGQVILPASTPPVRSAQVRNLHRLSDPLLSELSLDDLLDELLNRVLEVLDVDTVAILLLDREAQQLVARAAKGIEEEVERGVRIPIGRGFAGRIAAGRVPIAIADVDHADILNPILREKGIRSLLGVPLIVEGELIGVLHIGSLRARIFSEQDSSILQLAAARVAPAIERARLFVAFEHEHQVAMVLQRSLLPRSLPEAPGLSVAARYLPARGEVGGDWYDVIELPRGSLGVVIGDVVGHGIRAAALMGQLRTALRAYALEGHSPGRTLELLDRFAHTMGDGAMATTAYGTFDPVTGTLTYASAGHPPPVVIGADGTRVMELIPAPPIGAFPFSTWPEQEILLAADEILLLYTDGLVERRGDSVMSGIDHLCELIERADSPEEACLIAVDGLVPPEGPHDDVAVLAVRNVPLPVELSLELEARGETLASVRRVLRRWLVDRGAGAIELTEIMLAVNEACANAIEHAYAPGPATFDVSATVKDRQLAVTVRDTGSWRPPRGTDRGRGLSIIDAAMDEVEVNRRERGTEIIMRRRLSGS
jgi:anti-sigma regulatory factor (Ser/Thr protein kinase)